MDVWPYRSPGTRRDGGGQRHDAVMTVSESVREAKPRIPSPVFLAGLLVAAIFLVEVGVMWLVPRLQASWPYWVASILDAVILYFRPWPAIHFLVSRPLLRSLMEREESHQRLLEAHADLESRVTERTAALEVANRRLKDGFAVQERRSREMLVLSRMVNLFHACRTEVEARAVITRHVALLFPGIGGALFAFNASRNLVEAVATWGGGSPPEGFAADDCWSLRRGRPHVTEEGSCSGCHHVSSTAGALCVPMVAQGKRSAYCSSQHRRRAPLTRPQAAWLRPRRRASRWG